MASDDDLDYLTPGFDSATLTVPRLRSILVSHDVSYPSSAKKAQLIETFNQHVVPQAKKLLRARDRIRRTSEGIVNAETIPADDDSSDMLPPPVPDTARKRSNRKSVMPKLEETTPDPIVKPSTQKGSSAARSSKKSRETEVGTNMDGEPQRPSVRKSRKSEGPPVVKFEEDDHSRLSAVNGDSVFSHDNPFQSGSSPLSDNFVSPSEDRRRRTMGSSSTNDAAQPKRSDKRRKTEEPRSSRRVKTEPEPASVAHVGDNEDDNEDASDGIPVGEEFTPEEQMDLIHTKLVTGKKDVLPARRKAKAGAGRVSKSAPWVVLLTLFGGYATWWRREKLEVGYCGVGRPSTAIANVEIPEWASMVQPQCEPCPPHAYCYPYLETRCEPDFVLQPHPLSMGGLIPLPPTCQPDGAKVRKVRSITNRAVVELRERRADFECGTLTADESSKGPPKLEVKEQDLRRIVGHGKKREMSDDEFNDLWKSAVGELYDVDEIVVSQDKSHNVQLATTSLARLPIVCAMQRSARLAVARYRVELGGMVMLMGLVAAIRSRLRSLRHVKAQVPDLVKDTLQILATQAALHGTDQRAAPERWLSVGQLRDDVLRDEFSPKRREQLWKRVQQVVEMNANVRASVKETRGGDVSRVWEWIGSVGRVEDGWSGTRRDSGRLSLGRSGGSGINTPEQREPSAKRIIF
ncbi:MAG: inner nuclear membrane protein enriched at telomere/subtelomere region [Caeruleum heppii]|nr:MAG: inner nuclear membrane protein enriched at telomere/subtelomere region [Caeruleum heppii]